MDSTDFTNLLKIISPLSISVKKNIENFIDKNNNKKINNKKINKVEKFYNTIEATIPSSINNSTKTDLPKNNNLVVTKEPIKEPTKESTRDKIFRILYDIFNVLLGLWAAKISWKVNTIGHWSIIVKIIFAITAFFLAPLYLLLHFIFRYEYISNLNSPDTPLLSNTEDTSKSIFSFIKNKNTSVSQQPLLDIPPIPVKAPTIIPSINTKPPNSYISNNTNNTSNINSINSNSNSNKSKFI